MLNKIFQIIIWSPNNYLNQIIICAAGGRCIVWPNTYTRVVKSMWWPLKSPTRNFGQNRNSCSTLSQLNFFGEICRLQTFKPRHRIKDLGKFGSICQIFPSFQNLTQNLPNFMQIQSCSNNYPNRGDGRGSLKPLDPGLAPVLIIPIIFSTLFPPPHTYS